MKAYLVVAWDANVNMTNRGVAVAESNNWDVHVGSFSDRLVINAWVSHNQQTGLSVSSLQYKIIDQLLILS